MGMREGRKCSTRVARSLAVLSLLTMSTVALSQPLKGTEPSPEVDNSDNAPVAETIAQKRLLEILAALNGGEKAIAEFAAQNPGPPPPPDAEGPPPPSILGIMLESAAQSSGYSLLRFTQATATRAKARVRNRLTDQISELIVFAEAVPPHRIEGWGMRLLTDQEPFLGTTDSQRVAEISRFLKRLDDAEAFSGVVMIAKDGKPIFQQAYGLADHERRVPNTFQTRFRLASLSKMFTGFAIGRLVEQGKLSYEDPLSKFIPDFPDAASAKKIRIKHLLSHTSGLPGFHPPTIHNAQKRGSATAGIEALPKMKLESEPGSRWDYSNTGLLLLGRIIEIISGENYFDHIERTMLGPLALRQTGFPDYDRGARDLALPYVGELNSAGKLVLAVPEMRTRWGGPAGDAAANAPDLLRFAALLEGGKIVSPVTLQLHASRKPELTSPNYGYAIDFDFEGRDIYGHSGGAPGTCAQLGVIRDLPNRYSFVVLSNGYASSCRATVIKIGSTFAPPAQQAETLRQD